MVSGERNAGERERFLSSPNFFHRMRSSMDPAQTNGNSRGSSYSVDINSAYFLSLSSPSAGGLAVE